MKKRLVVINGESILAEPMVLYHKQPNLAECEEGCNHNCAQYKDCSERMELGVPLMCEKLSVDDVLRIRNHEQRERVLSLFRYQGLELDDTGDLV